MPSPATPATPAPFQTERRLVYMPLALLKPAKRNPKAHDMAALGASVSKFGYVEPVVLDERTKRLVSGHGRVELLHLLSGKGESPPDGVKLGGDGAWQVPVVRGWASRSDSEAEAFLLAANRTGELGGWDDAQLAAVLGDLAKADALEGTGYAEADLDALLAGVAGPPGLTEPDDVPELPAEPWVKAGDLFALGEHRLLCGDCRRVSDVERLLAGRKVNVAVTSPPYASQRAYDESSGFKPIPPDEYVEWFAAVAANVAATLAPDGSWFVNIKEHAYETQRDLYVKRLVLAHVETWGWRFVEEYCWVHHGTPKKVETYFKNGWEPIFHFSRERQFKFRPEDVMHETDAPIDLVDLNGGRNMASLQGTRTGRRGPQTHASGAQGDPNRSGWRAGDAPMAYPSNVLSLGKNREALGHSAAFPVALPSFFIRAFSDAGDAIFDPFMGSGTTLIAAEQEKRTAYGTEISPRYCQVVLERWEKFTRKKAEKL